MAKNGDLIFHHHEKGFIKTKPNCECAEFLKLWREGNLQDNDCRLVGERNKGKEKAANRKILFDKPQESLKERLHFYKIKNSVLGEIRKSQRDRGYTKAFRLQRYVESQNGVSVWGITCIVWNTFIIQSGIDWETSVFNKGLAVVDGFLVFEVEETNEPYTYKAKILATQKELENPKKTVTIRKMPGGKPFIIRERKNTPETEHLFPAKHKNYAYHQVSCITSDDCCEHVIGRGYKGRLYFTGHNKNFLKQERMLMLLGGTACSCYETARDLIQTGKNEERIEFRNNNQNFFNHYYEWTFLDEIIYEYKLEALSKIIKLCFARINQPLDCITHNEYLEVVERDFLIKGWRPTCCVLVGTGTNLDDWYRDVYKKGFARISDCFIAKIEHDSEGNVYAHALLRPFSSESVGFEKMLVKKGNNGYYLQKP